MGLLRKYRFGTSSHPSSRCRWCGKEKYGESVKGQWCSTDCLEQEEMNWKYQCDGYNQLPKRYW